MVPGVVAGVPPGVVAGRGPGTGRRWSCRRGWGSWSSQRRWVLSAYRLLGGRGVVGGPPPGRVRAAGKATGALRLGQGRQQIVCSWSGIGVGIVEQRGERGDEVLVGNIQERSLMAGGPSLIEPVQRLRRLFIEQRQPLVDLQGHALFDLLQVLRAERGRMLGTRGGLVLVVLSELGRAEMFHAQVGVRRV